MIQCSHRACSFPHRGSVIVNFALLVTGFFRKVAMARRTEDACGEKSEIATRRGNTARRSGIRSDRVRRDAKSRRGIDETQNDETRTERDANGRDRARGDGARTDKTIARGNVCTRDDTRATRDTVHDEQV